MNVHLSNMSAHREMPHEGRKHIPAAILDVVGSLLFVGPSWAIVSRLRSRPVE